MTKFRVAEDISEINMDIVNEFVKSALGHAFTDEELEADKKAAMASRTKEFRNIVKLKNRCKKAMKRIRAEKKRKMEEEMLKEKKK